MIRHLFALRPPVRVHRSIGLLRPSLSTTFSSSSRKPDDPELTIEQQKKMEMARKIDSDGESAPVEQTRPQSGTNNEPRTDLQPDLYGEGSKKGVGDELEEKGVGLTT